MARARRRRGGSVWTLVVFVVAIGCAAAILAADLNGLPIARSGFAVVGLPILLAALTVATAQTTSAREQRASFQRELTMGKVAELYEQVLALLGDVVADRGRRTLDPAKVRAIIEAAYRAHTYIADQELLATMVQAFEAAALRDSSEFARLLDKTSLAFRRHLADVTYISGNDDFDDTHWSRTMQDHVRRLYRALAGLERDAAVVPVRLRLRGFTEATWHRFRFDNQVTEEELEAVASVRSQDANFFGTVRPGDLLVFWRNPAKEANDGVYGVAWVDRVRNEEGAKRLDLGRKLTVGREQFVRFSTLGGGFARTSDAEAEEGSPQSELERQIRKGERIPPDALTYAAAEGLLRLMSALESRRIQLRPGEGLEVPCKVHGHARSIVLLVDFTAHQRPIESERFVEDILRRNNDGEGMVVYYERQEFPVTSINLVDNGGTTAFYLSVQDLDSTNRKLPPTKRPLVLSLTVDAYGSLLLDLAEPDGQRRE